MNISATDMNSAYKTKRNLNEIFGKFFLSFVNLQFRLDVYFEKLNIMKFKIIKV